MPPGLRSIEAEQSVLGALLIDSAAWADVSSLIGPESFSHTAYRDIFGALSVLVAERSEVDVITVHDCLRRSGKAEACGGLAHLNELAQSVPSAAGAKRYAAIVADRAKRRAMLQVIDGASETIGAADSADAALSELQGRLGALSRISARTAPRRIGELVSKRIAYVQAVNDGQAQPGWPTGIPKLDVAFNGGLRGGQVVVLAARPSVGKTSLALQILLAVGADGGAGLMLSQEMTGGELAGRALAHGGGIRMDRLATGQLDAEEWGALTEQERVFASLPVWVDDQPALRIVDIEAKARAIKREAGELRLVVIDYLQLCAAEASKGDARSRHHQIEAISRGIKALAKELDCCVLLLSQLNRSAEDGEPELWHLKESGAVEEDADIVMLMFQMGDAVCVKVAKNRGGRRGRIALSFDGAVQRWTPSNADVSRRGGRGGSE